MQEVDRGELKTLIAVPFFFMRCSTHFFAYLSFQIARITQHVGVVFTDGYTDRVKRSKCDDR